MGGLGLDDSGECDGRGHDPVDEYDWEWDVGSADAPGLRIDDCGSSFVVGESAADKRRRIDEVEAMMEPITPLSFPLWSAAAGVLSDGVHPSRGDGDDLCRCILESKSLWAIDSVHALARAYCDRNSVDTFGPMALAKAVEILEGWSLNLTRLHYGGDVGAVPGIDL